MNKPADTVLMHPCTHWFRYLLDGRCVLGVCWEYRATQRLAGITGMSLISSVSTLVEILVPVLPTDEISEATQ